jgi:pSer/pThr/pTyr-binding forkhead associated (FHA) protein
MKHQQIEFVIKVLNGPDKGAVYKLMSAHVKIGRGDDNDIVLTGDTKCSRYHASLTLSENGIEIRDISDRNSVLVNSQQVTHAILLPGSVVQLGDTKLQFNIGGATNLLAPASAHAPVQNGQRKPRKQKTSGLSPTFYIVLGVLGLLVVYLLNSPTGPKKSEPALRTEQEVLNTIDKNRQLVQDIAEQKRQDGRESDQYKEAQANFIKGFRDFQKGQFERALDYFQTCLSIYPQHAQCNQYYTEAKTKFSELVQYYLNLGYEYQRKNQFSQCRSAFNNVRVMQKDRNSTVYKEADTGHAACEALERSAR